MILYGVKSPAEETHKYIHPKDETGNAEYISVITLIKRLFPFDLKRYVEKKALQNKKSAIANALINTFDR